MKKIMIAGLGLSLLSGTAVFAQNSSAGQNGTTDNSTMSGKKHKKHKKNKKNKGTENSTTTTAPQQ